MKIENIDQNETIASVKLRIKSSENDFFSYNSLVLDIDNEWKIINMIGCLLIGLLIGVLGQNIQTNQSLKLLLIVGFCGGYTTFSTLAVENLTLIQDHQYWTAIGYTLASIVIGLLAVWIGFKITQ